MGAKTTSALSSLSPSTLNELLLYNVSRYQFPNMLNGKADGKWYSISNNELWERVKKRALGLHHLGVRSGDRVALLAENSPEWVMCDYANLACGAITVPIYVTQAVRQVEYILKDAGAKTFVISSQKLFDRVREVLPKVELERILVFTPFVEGKNILALATVEQFGEELEKREPELYDKLRTSIRPSDIATIMYTSGTTGEPKGVVLTHGNLTLNAIDGSASTKFRAGSDVALSYLPLSHVFERTVINIYLYHGVPTYFAESIETLAQNLLEVRPSTMSTVPRMLEKVYDKILLKGSQLAGVKRKLFDWSVRLARQYDPEKGTSPWYALQRFIASLVVFSKWRAAIGGRIRFIISGAAALPPSLARIYAAAGIEIHQGYGLTETSPVIAVNTADRNRFGSVGPVIRNVQVKISDDGEILVKGPHVMKEFHNAPEATKAVFDGEWFRTGDIGYLDKEGFLFITDRKKDLIKKSNGKFVAPGPIESALKESRYVEYAVVLGEGRRFAIAILFPNFLNLSAWAKEHGIESASNIDLVAHPDVQRLYEEGVAFVNERLNQWERIIKFIVSDHELTISEGLLTPTMKVRRREIEKKFAQEIKALYDAHQHVEVPGE